MVWTITQHRMLLCHVAWTLLYASCPGEEIRCSREGLGLDTCHYHYVFCVCIDWLVDVFIPLTSMTWGVFFFSSLFFKLNFLFCSDSHLFFRSLTFGCCSVCRESFSKLELWSLFKSHNSYWGFVSLDPSWFLSLLFCCNTLSHLESVTKAPWQPLCECLCDSVLVFIPLSLASLFPVSFLLQAIPPSAAN